MIQLLPLPNRETPSPGAPEDWFALRLTRLPLCLYRQDGDLRYLWVHNPPAPFAAAEVVGRTDAELLAEDVAALVIAAKREVLATGSGICRQVTLKLRGEERRFLGTAEPIRNPGGEICGLGGALLDLTECCRAEDRAEELELRFRTLVERLPALTYLLDPGDINRPRYISPQALAMTGVPPDQWFSEPGVFFRLIHPEDRAKVAAQAEAARHSDGPFTLEFRMVAADGRVLWVRDQSLLLRDESGKPLYWMGIALDITELKDAEAELRAARSELELRVQLRTAELEQANQALRHEVAARTEALRALALSEERYRDLFDNASDFIYTHDLQGVFTSVNRAAERFTGWTAADTIGQSIFSALAPESHEDIRRMLSRALEEGQTNFELQVRSRTGQTFFVEVGARLICRDRAPVGVQGIVRDVTERRAAEQMLRENQAELERNRKDLRALAAGLLTAQEDERKRLSRELHDDLNQRLAMLQFQIERLQKHVSTDELRRKLLSVRDQVAGLSDDVRRMAQQLHPAVLQHLGLAAALEAHCSDVSTHERIRVRFVRRTLPRAIPPETELCLYRIAQEGLSNVVKHSGAKRATVTLTGRAGAIRLSVLDRGSGFEPARVKGGGGLGIIGMEERIRLLGGSLEIVSQPGAGTRVTAIVPLPESLS